MAQVMGPLVARGEKLKKSSLRPVLCQHLWAFVWRSLFQHTSSSEEPAGRVGLSLLSRANQSRLWPTPEIYLDWLVQEMNGTALTGQLRQAIAGIYGLWST